MWAVARDSSNSHCTELGDAFGWNPQIWSASQVLCLCSTAWKVSKYGVFSGPYFAVFGLNTEINGVNIRIQSEYGKIRTRNNSVFGHFSHSVVLIKSTKLVAKLASQAQVFVLSPLCMLCIKVHEITHKMWLYVLSWQHIHIWIRLFLI